MVWQLWRSVGPKTETACRCPSQNAESHAKAIGLDGRSIDQIVKGVGTYTNTAKARSDRAAGIVLAGTRQLEVPRQPTARQICEREV